ncbi:uncharacterized protein KY384_002735 [Bacidia gigantensis]|uniref:uncharacterized protein n=1 Tax=Bacidia gigantensis TaxID=2732470 RepID=UPI001D03E141|nr:uncharacterized protein KY384_002735 [Bacidia gigantensis]KAG8532857.1 hypothetical protein KY384_002735 [Bacidia gigantensis]
MIPSFASNSSSFRNGPITLPLAKFSHCTVATHSSPMRWIHVAGNHDDSGHGDLFTVFDTFRRMDVNEQMAELHLLKVDHRGDLLEKFEFEMLSRQVRSDNIRAQGRILTEMDRHMVAVARASLNAVAMRYQTLDRKIRKLQFIFHTVSGFNFCIETLQSFAIPIIIKDNEARPTSTQSLPVLNHNSTLYSTPSIESSTNRYGGAQASSFPPHVFQSGYSQNAQRTLQPARQPPYLDPSWAPSSAQPIQTFANEPSLSQYGSQGSSQGMASFGYHQASMDSYPNRDTSQVNSWHPALMPFQDTGRSIQQGTSVSQAGAQVLPFEHTAYQSTHANPSQGRPFSAPEPHDERLTHDSYTMKDIMPPPRTLPFPEPKSKPSSAQGIEKPLGERTAPQQASSQSNRTKTATKPRQSRPRKSKAAQSVLEGAVSKPDTSIAPKPTPKPNKASVIVPPLSSDPLRTVETGLAFQRKYPNTRATDPSTHAEDHSSSLDRSDILAPTPLKNPPKRRRVAGTTNQDPKTPTPAPLTQIIAKTSADTAIKSSEAPVNKNSQAVQADLDKAPDSVTVGQAGASMNVGPLPPFAQRSIQTQTLPIEPPSAETTGNVQPSNTGNSQPAVPKNPMLSHIQSDECLDRLEHWIRKHHDLPALQPTMTDQERDRERLAHYAAQPDEERLRIMDNMICECLEDDNFLSLLKDVERTWRRTALGSSI